MSETIFAFNATSASSDHYLGLCRIPEKGTQLSIIGNLVDSIRDATGEEYAYLEDVSLYTDSPEHQGRCRDLAIELIHDFRRAYEREL